MQIIIEIPDDKIPTRQCYKDVLIKFVDRQVCEVTMIGQIPREDETGLWFDVLPEGHGRLGDLDELETYFKNVRKKLKPEDYKYAVEYFTRDNMLLNAEQFIHLMDALIPADKEGELNGQANKTE